MTIAGIAGDFERARTLCEESVAVSRKIGSTRGEGIAYFILAEAAVNCGRYPEAHEAGGRALELGRRFEDPEVMALALARLGLAAASEGRLVEARERLLEALECVQLLGFTEVGAYCCEALALVAAGWGEARGATRLLGAADAFRQATGAILLPAEAAARTASLGEIGRTLKGDEIEAELALGRVLTLDEVTEEARALSAPTP